MNITPLLKGRWRLPVELTKRVLGKLDEMRHYLDDLEGFLPSDEDEYLENTQRRRACEKTTELAIESVISILSMIISHKKYGLPGSEDDLIAIAKKKKVLSPALAEKVQKMKGFRNVLVHRYENIDDHQAFENISRNRKDFIDFEREIRRWIKSSGNKS